VFYAIDPLEITLPKLGRSPPNFQLKQPLLHSEPHDLVLKIQMFQKMFVNGSVKKMMRPVLVEKRQRHGK
jgi:hypothetical protein